MALIQQLAELSTMLVQVSEAIDYERQGCPASRALAQDLADLADEVCDFALAIDMVEQESTRH